MKKTLFLSTLLALMVGHAAWAVTFVDDAKFTHEGTAYTLTADYSWSGRGDNSSDVGSLNLNGHTMTINVTTGGGSTTNVRIGTLSGAAGSAYTQNREHSGSANTNSIWVGNAADFYGSITTQGYYADGSYFLFGIGTTDKTTAVDMSHATLNVTNTTFVSSSNNASIGTLNIKDSEIRYSAGSQPANLGTTRGVNTAGTGYSNAGSASDSATITVNSLTMKNTVLKEYITLALTGNGSIDADSTVKGNISVLSGGNLDFSLGSDSIVEGSEKAYTGTGNSFGSAQYRQEIGYLTLNGGSVSIRGEQADYTNGVLTGTAASTTYFINSSSAAIDMTGARDIVVAAKGIALTGSTVGFANQNSLTLVEGASVSLSGDRVYDGDVTINKGSTLSMLSSDALQYGGTAEAKTLTIAGTLAMGNKRLSIGNNYDGTTLAHYKIVMNGGSVTGNGDGQGALDFFNTSNLVVSGVSKIEGPIRVRNGKTLQVEVTGETDSLTLQGELMQQNNTSNGSIALSGAGTLTISAANNMTGGLAVNSGTLVANHASALGKGSVTVASGATLEIAKGITASGFSSLNFAEGANAAINGTLALSNDAVTLHSLTMGASGLLELNSHNGTLTTSTLTVSGNSTINANLVVNDNGTMDFSNHTELTMGCTVTIGDYVTIMIDDSELASIVSGNSVMTIINDVEGVDMNNLALTLGSGWKFVDAQGNSLDAYNLRLDVVDAGNGKVNIVVAPEPATATLSLLALAGLCARRRRH